jgi:hypothetical protein
MQWDGVHIRYVCLLLHSTTRLHSSRYAIELTDLLEQWYVWVLCGLGYFLDLLWSQAFVLASEPLRQELGFDSESHR